MVQQLKVNANVVLQIIPLFMEAGSRMKSIMFKTERKTIVEIAVAQISVVCSTNVDTDLD